MTLETLMEQLPTNTKAFNEQTRSFMAETETKIENQEALIKSQAESIHNLKVQIG